MTYREILQSIKDAKTAEDIQESRRQSNFAELNGDLSMTEISLLGIARDAMRHALRCRTFSAVARLEHAYARIYKRELGSGAFHFFTWLLVNRRMKLYHASAFGQQVKRLFTTHPKLVLASIDGRISVSGRGQ